MANNLYKQIPAHKNNINMHSLWEDLQHLCSLFLIQVLLTDNVWAYIACSVDSKRWTGFVKMQC